MALAVFDSGEELAEAAADAVLEIGRASHRERGCFRVGLSGGRTPRELYARLAAPPRRQVLRACRPVIVFADERAVPPDHPDSNYAMVRAALLDPAGIQASCVHRMRGETQPLAAAAVEYESAVREPLDLLILGVGPDGHTASIFPHSAAAAETDRRVVAVTDSPKPPPRRLTVTPVVIAEARSIFVLATGADKAPAIRRALDPDTAVLEIPARLLRERQWFVDRAASGRGVAA